MMLQIRIFHLIYVAFMLLETLNWIEFSHKNVKSVVYTQTVNAGQLNCFV